MSILIQRRERSLAILDQFLADHYGGQKLNNDELIGAELFGTVGDAWSIQPGVSPVVPQLYVGVDARYPATLPRVLLPNPTQWHLNIPHVGKDGGICVVPEQATGDAGRLTNVAEEIIRQAISTIEDGISGRNRADFVSEIESYWAGAV
jgi:Prokaryotic E2 family B